MQSFSPLARQSRFGRSPSFMRNFISLWGNIEAIAGYLLAKHNAIKSRFEVVSQIHNSELRH
jgi:hypothetical protein